jgi:hypothetical protein
MGLMDKVTAQATQLAQKTQETARDSKAKFDQAQANWRADAMLRNLGAVAYAERTGRGSPDARAQIDKLVHDISAHKTQHGISLASQPAIRRARKPAPMPNRVLAPKLTRNLAPMPEPKPVPTASLAVQRTASPPELARVSRRRPTPPASRPRAARAGYPPDAGPAQG